MKIECKTDLAYHNELRAAINNLCLLHDDLMSLAFDKNIEATELLLTIILGRSDIKVIEALAQREYKNPMAGGRSIVLDIYAKDKDGKVYDIEVQRASSGADVHRARFHSSMIDAKMLNETQKFKELHDSYVIFITEHDMIGKGLSLYHVERIYKETGALFQDGSHIIYVNGSYKNDNDPVGKLMHDFRCTESEHMFYPVLAKQVKYFKESEGGGKRMDNAFEELAVKVGKQIAVKMAKEMAEEKAKEIAEEKAKEIAEEIVKQRVEELAEQEKKTFACRMLTRGKLTIEEIAEDTELSVEAVKELAKMQTA